MLRRSPSRRRTKSKKTRLGRDQWRARCKLGIESLERRQLLAGAVFEVINIEDAGSGSLRQAIVQANANPGSDIIRFSRGVEGTIELSSQLVITDDVTIRGPGHDKLAVSGGDDVRVFAVIPAALAEDPFVTPTSAQVATAPKVAIEKLAILDGHATDAPGFDPADPTNPGFAFGGGLYNLGGTVQLREVVMSGNVASNVVTAGGAVANEFGGTLTVTRSDFDSNASSGILIAVGGAITSDLGPTADGAVTQPPTVSIERSKFVANSAEASAGYVEGEGFSGLGGGGAILNVTGSMTISRSHFEDNTAQGGGGIAGLPLPDSTSGGPGFGGAILSGDASPFGIADSHLNVSRSTFVGNSAMGGDGRVNGIPGGQAAGGAISIGNGTDARLERNEFVENVAVGGGGGEDAAGGIASGGAVSGSGGAFLTQKATTLKLLSNTFLQNAAAGGTGTGIGASAAGRGGGLALFEENLAGFFPGQANAEVVGDRYQENHAAGGIGGGVYNEGDLSINRASLSGNQAIGKADVVIDFVPDYQFQGAALGGGLSNLGSVDIVGTTFHGNAALGASGATGPNFFASSGGTAIPTYPGLAAGGGLHNINDATVTRSRIGHNEALGGNGNSGSFAGVANGGGIYNDGSIIVKGSKINENLTVGGSDNTGDINPGGGYGGGLTSGSVAALVGARSASVVVARSSVHGNEAVGGDGNQNLPDLGLPPAHAASGGTGGGILVYQGTAEITGTRITANQAVGGFRGIGSGGGVFFYGFVGTVDGKLSNSLVSGNVAVGGAGSNGLGGGIAAGSLGSLFAAPNPVFVDVEGSLIKHNRAVGGDNGDGLGGGIYIGSDSVVDLSRSLVFRNHALGGTNGAGRGGGIFNDGGSLDLARAWIFANYASTSDDDCFGC